MSKDELAETLGIVNTSDYWEVYNKYHDWKKKYNPEINIHKYNKNTLEGVKGKVFDEYLYERTRAAYKKLMRETIRPPNLFELPFIVIANGITRLMESLSDNQKSNKISKDAALDQNIPAAGHKPPLSQEASDEKPKQPVELVKSKPALAPQTKPTITKEFIFSAPNARDWSLSQRQQAIKALREISNDPTCSVSILSEGEDYLVNKHLPDEAYTGNVWKGMTKEGSLGFNVEEYLSTKYGRSRPMGSPVVEVIDERYLEKLSNTNIQKHADNQTNQHHTVQDYKNELVTLKAHDSSTKNPKEQEKQEVQNNNNKRPRFKL